MRAPPNAERAAPALAGNGSLKTDRLASSINTAINTERRLPQLRCAFCGKQFPKTSKRPARCCSRRCRDGLLRETARSNGAWVSPVGFGCCSLKKQSSSRSCNGTSRDPHPSRFSVPVDLLGRGHRWPGAAKLDRKTRAKILWREGCTP
jgi:hypothetical protein